MPRLFTGIALPEDVRDGLAALETPLPGARWVESDNLHLTLTFVGDVDNRSADEFAGLLADIAMPAFELRLTGLGTFAGKDPKVIWAGVDDGSALERLARANARAARLAGLSPEGRPFRPHVTLARLRHANAEALARFLGRKGAFYTDPFVVTEFVLFSARPKTGGGPYVIEAAYPLSTLALSGRAGHGLA